MRHPVVDEDLRQILSLPLPWERLAGRTVLVTGAAGCLPAYVVETVLAWNERGEGPPAKVIGMVRCRERAEQRLAAYQGRPDLVLLEQDVCTEPAKDLRADWIVHAASPASPKYYVRDPIGTISANVRGTEHMLALAERSAAAGLLYLSTSEIYGRLSADQIPVREDQFGELDPTDSRSCYAESKRLGETLCATWSRQRGVPAKIVRPFHSYGPGMRLDDGRVFADFVADVLASRPIVLRSDGRQTRSFTYVADVAAALFTVLFHGEPGRAYNIGDEAGEISVRALAERLVAVFPERNLSVIMAAPVAADPPPSPADRSCPNTSRLRALGWKPWTSIAEGYRRTVAYYS